MLNPLICCKKWQCKRLCCPQEKKKFKSLMLHQETRNTSHYWLNNISCIFNNMLISTRTLIAIWLCICPFAYALQNIRIRQPPVISKYVSPPHSSLLSVTNISPNYQSWKRNTKSTHLDAATALLPASFTTLAKNNWYVWTWLAVSSAIGIRGERTKLGAMFSAPLCTMAISLLACNLGLLPAVHPVYDTVSKVFVPLAVPLLLLDADVRKVFVGTGSLLKAFLVGSIGTVIGTLVAYLLVPMRGIVGSEKIAAALCARHIGGALNFVAVSDVLRTSPELVAAAMAADNVVVAVYFIFLFAISVPDKVAAITSTASPPTSSTLESSAININEPPLSDAPKQQCPFRGLMGTSSPSNSSDLPIVEGDASTSLSTSSEASSTVSSTISSSPPPPQPKPIAAITKLTTESKERLVDPGSMSTSLAIACLLVCISECLYSLFGASKILTVSLLAVLASTAFPKMVGSAAAGGQALGLIAMQFYFAVTGAMGHIPTVLKLAPSLLLHSSLQVAIHFLVAVNLGKIFKLPFNEICLASNANVGGPSTASAMATSKRWKSLIMPALLTGILGYAIATFVGLIMYRVLLKL